MGANLKSLNFVTTNPGNQAHWLKIGLAFPLSIQAQFRKASTILDCTKKKRILTSEIKTKLILG
jgi:hypothetical protein